MIVTAWNPETDELEKTYLSQVVQKNSSSLKVKNADRFAQNKRILIGEMGMEQSEIMTTDAGITTDTLPLTGNTKFAHAADTPVYVLRYDQVQFYRSTSADGVYTLLAAVNIDVDNRDQKTVYEDNTGSGTSFYKTKFYNSITSEESEFSDYISAAGYGEQTIGKVIESSVRRLGDKEYTILSSEDYIDIATEVNYDISSQSERPYDFTRHTVKLNRVAGQAYLEFPEDYYKYDDLVYMNQVGGYPRTRKVIPIPIDTFYTGYGAMAASDNLSKIAIDDEARRILLKPAPLTNYTGAYVLRYYRRLGEFKNLSDPVWTPNTLIYRYKFMSEFYAKKAETDPSFASLSTRYEQKYGTELMKLQRTNRKDVGTPRSFMSSQRRSSSTYQEGRRYEL